MTRVASPRLAAYATLAGAALLAGLALGRVELIALAAPFVLAGALAPLLAGTPELETTFAVERERALESELVDATIGLTATAPVDRVDVLLRLPSGLGTDDGNPRAISVRANESRRIVLSLRCHRWGAFLLGPPLLRVRDRLGFYTWEPRAGAQASLRVYPAVETARTLLAPLETQVFVGNQVSRARHDGIEFADIREWEPGDRLRRINWRVSARREGLWVNEQHPERNTDVVLFLDTFADVGSSARGTLDLTVRAATSLAQRYLQRRDRVGLVTFGGFLSWLLPSSGTLQLYKIVDSLLQVDVVLSYAAKGVDVLPPRSLPPKALVLALSPLLDRRSAGALLDLHARGFDLVVIEVSPLPFFEPDRDEIGRLSYRLWRLSRELLRAGYERAGVPVVEWQAGTPLDVPIEEVRTFRRFARRARA